MKRPQVKIRKQTNKVTGKTVYIVGSPTTFYTKHRYLCAARRSVRTFYKRRADLPQNWSELEDVE